MKIKAATIIRIILAVIAFFLALIISYMVELNKSMSSTNSMIKGEKDMLAVKVTDVMKQKIALEGQLTAVTGEKDLLLSKVNEYEVKSKSMEAKISALEEKTREIRRDFAKREMQMEDLNQKKDKEIFQLKEKIEESESKVQGLSNKLDSAHKKNREKKEARQSVTKKDEALEVAPVVVESRQINRGLEAKVLEVNSEFDFIVMNAGALDGVREGDSMYVVRNKEVLGRVVIEKTEDNYAVARLLYKTLQDTVELGDKVRY